MSETTTKMKATEFKAHCLEIRDQVKAGRKEVVVTKHGKPVAKIEPADSLAEPIFGCMKGTAKAVGKIFSTGEKWEPGK